MVLEGAHAGLQPTNSRIRGMGSRGSGFTLVYDHLQRS